MNERELQNLLELVRAGELAPSKAIERLKHMPFEDLGFAKVDHHRALRQGFAEVIFGKGKSPQHVAEIVRSMLSHRDSKHNILVTRADEKIFAAVRKLKTGKSSAAKFHSLSRAITIERNTRDFRQGHDFRRVGGNERHSCRGRSAAYSALDGESRRAFVRRGRRGDSSAAGASRSADKSPRGDLHRGNGRRAAERGRRVGCGSGDCGADERRGMARASAASRRCWGC